MIKFFNIFTKIMTFSTTLWISCLVIVVASHETNLQKELVLNYKEAIAFNKFKSQVWQNVSKESGFMKTDLYLLRWLRAKDVDVHRATKDMFEWLEFRKVNHFDTLLSEDFSDMKIDHPYRMDVVDLQGRPVGMGSIGGRWNIRRTLLSGKMPRLRRYVYKLVEEIFDLLYEVNHEHQNVTQFSAIVSMDGFNVFQQACPACLTLYVQLLSWYNQFYPSFVHTLISINTPPSFNVILDLVKPLFNRPTRDALKIYGYDKRVWKPVLDQEVSEDQLTAEFGGTKPDFDYDEMAEAESYKKTK